MFTERCLIICTPYMDDAVYVECKQPIGKELIKRLTKELELFCIISEFTKIENFDRHFFKKLSALPFIKSTFWIGVLKMISV